MKVGALVLSAGLAALAGCTSGQSNQSAGGGAGSEASVPAAGAASAPGTAAAPGIDPNLPEEIDRVVTMLKGKLPLQQRGATIVDMEARGAEIIHTIKVPQNLDAATFAHFQAQLPVRTCGDPSARWAVDRGGTTTYKILDKEGELFTASVTGCPTAPPPPVEGPVPVEGQVPVEGM